MALINVSQINGVQLQLAVQQYASGAAFSGNITNYVNASGFLGNQVVYVTGSQSITGVKTFRDSPIVPYSGNTGSAPSTLWVIDRLNTSGAGLTAATNALSGYVDGVSGALSYVRVTGSSTINAVNFTGLGGTLVIYSGGQIFISGAAAGGAGSSNVSVTGSSTISSPNFTGVGSVTLTYDGTFIRVSGSAAGATSVGSWNAVYTTGNQTINDHKIFTGSPWVAVPTQPSGATNVLYVSGASGSLVSQMVAISGAIIAGSTTVNNYYITGTGVVAASSTGTVTNTFNITSGNASVSSSGTVNNTFNGTVNNTTNIGTITGNFVNVSLYLDEYNLTTGLNIWETPIGRSFTFTGYALGTINTGTQGWFSGSFYQRTPTNVKTTFVDFSLNNGTFFTANGGFVQEISGMNRLGLDIYRVGTGITGLSVAAFGFG